MPDRTAIYIRETYLPDQTDQLHELQKVAADRGLVVTDVHIDRQGSLSSNRKRLPALAAIIAAIERGTVDFVLVTTLSQLGISVDGLLDTLAAMHKAGVHLIVLDQVGPARTDLLDLAQPLVRARRDYKREATVVGQIKARVLGVRFGRPPISVNRIQKVKVALAEGNGVRQTARRYGISAAKVSAVRTEMRSATEHPRANR